jgi:hypothetical protein
VAAGRESQLGDGSTRAWVNQSPSASRVSEAFHFMHTF